MPQVQERVAKEFSCEIKRTDPNQIVAKGAAIYGHRCQLNQEILIRIAEKTGEDADAPGIIDQASAEIQEEAKREVAEAHGMALPGFKRLVETEITNVTSKSFGLKVIKDDITGISNMVLLDDKVPRIITRPFSTYEEGQTWVSLEVYENHDRQGEEVLLDVEQCTQIGVAELAFLRALPKGSPIEVRFELTEDGLLKLHGLDQTTQQEIRAEFKTESIMSFQELTEAQGHNRGLTVS